MTPDPCYVKFCHPAQCLLTALTNWAKSPARFFRQVAACVPYIFLTFINWTIIKLLITQMPLKMEKK